MRLLLFLFLFLIMAGGQQTYRGNIVDKKTKAAVPFATIGLARENIGTNADEQGNFSLASAHQKTNDSLIVSCVGYEALRIPVDKLTSGVTIELHRREVPLRAVTVSSKINWTSSELNSFSKCGNRGLVTNGYQTQVAQHLKTPVSNSILTGIRICTQTLSLAPAPTLFRVRIYDMDSSTGKPSVDLSDEVIEVKSKSRTIQLDLEKYRIRIPNKDFFVAIEWLKIPYNENKVVVRHEDGKKEELTRYGPSISIKEDEADGLVAWMLTYRHDWMPLFPGKRLALISATVKY